MHKILLDCVSSNQAQPLLKGMADIGVLAAACAMIDLMAMTATLQAEHWLCLQQRPAGSTAAEVSCRWTLSSQCLALQVHSMERDAERGPASPAKPKKTGGLLGMFRRASPPSPPAPTAAEPAAPEVSLCSPASAWFCAVLQTHMEVSRVVG